MMTEQQTELSGSEGQAQSGSEVAATTWLDTVFVFLAAALLFSLTITHFVAAVTDVSAQRILSGAVPYRDFWTMYAPGSMYTMAGAYAVFGTHMIVGKILGALVAAGAVAAFHRLGLRMAGRPWAAAGAGLFGLSLFSSGYHMYLGSFPPALLLILLAAGRLASDAANPSRRRLLEAGLLLGAAAVFKHDIAGYACIASGVALLATGRGLRAVAAVAITVLAVALPVVVFLAAAGAGRDAWTALVTYPLGDFRVVRPESFPIMPEIWWGDLWQRVDRGIWWATLNAPTIALLIGAAGMLMSRRLLGPAARRLGVFIVVAFPLFWLAAHVQANTHKVTMAGLGVLLLLAGAPFWSRRLGIPQPIWLVPGLIAWAGVLLFNPVQNWGLGRQPREALDLPRLEWITVPEPQAEWMTGLSNALHDVAPPDVGLLLLGWRNDVMIHASTQVFWLSGRRIVGGHHELHPGITDTEPVQREMLESVRSEPTPPVIVREHRFNDRTLDYWGEVYREGGVPVGAVLLDAWVDENYESVGRYGMYEIMRPHAGWPGHQVRSSGATGPGS